MSEQRPFADMTFEGLLGVLEQLIARMESGEIGIEEAVDLYEQAEEVQALAAERLARVQERINARAGAGGGAAS